MTEPKRDWKKYVLEQYLNIKANSTDTQYEEYKEELKQLIFDAYCSGDIKKILNAAKTTIHLDNLGFTKQEFEIIKDKTTDLPTSNICVTRDYRADVNASIMVLDNFNKGNKCKCNLYEKWIQFSPDREIEMGFLTLTKPIFGNVAEYRMEYDLKCRYCGGIWHCNENNGYHYPTYEWEKPGANSGE